MPPLLNIDGKPTFLLGVNYWSRPGGPRMWERFDPARIRQELRQMQSMGLNTCRSFAFIPTFMPSPPAVSSIALTRFRDFLNLCQEERMHTIPSFLVGHMSGENYEFPGQNGRSSYIDAEIISWEQALIRGLAGVSANHSAVIAYLATNEMPHWGGKSTPETIANWAALLKKTLHEKDREKPFSLGDGVMNLKGGQNGFDVRTLRSIVDFIGPHTYYADADPLRQAYNAEFCLRSLTYLGLPLLFEEFGTSSSQVSDENQVLYYREVIHACLSIGAAGALGWCFSDFALEDDPPYTHHAFELGFGITRADGSEKPVCNELRRISALIGQLDVPNLEHPRPKAAILVPSYFNTTYPFSWEDRDRMRRTFLQTYALCCCAGLEIELIPEEQDLSPYRLVLCPSTQKLLSTTWRNLLLHARRGNTVYWSYFSGDYNFHQGAWCQNFSDLTLCRHQLRYACFDAPDELTILEGSQLRLKIRTSVGKLCSQSYLPIETIGAEVLAKDHHGRPALTRAAQGAGEVIFLNHPLEYYLAEQFGDGKNSGVVDLYRLIAKRSGLLPSVSSSDPTVQVRLVNQKSKPLLWLFNHSWNPVDTNIESPGGVPVYGIESSLSEGATSLHLAPKQAVIFELDCSIEE